MMETKPDSISSVRLFAMIVIIQCRHQTGTEHTPQQRIRQTNLTMHIHWCAAVIPYLITPVPYAATEILYACDSGAAKQRLYCEAGRQFAYSVYKKRCCTACNPHGIMCSAAIKQFQCGIPQCPGQKNLIHLSSPQRKYAHSGKCVNRPVSEPKDITIFYFQNH